MTWPRCNNTSATISARVPPCCWTSWHRLHRVQAPTLVLMGADDPIVPPVNGRIVAARLKRVTLETVDCGHLFVLTRPRETARRVERFIADHALAA